jgi:hypothetical protein
VEVVYQNLRSAQTGTGSVVSPAGFAPYAFGGAIDGQKRELEIHRAAVAVLGTGEKRHTVDSGDVRRNLFVDRRGIGRLEHRLGKFGDGQLRYRGRVVEHGQRALRPDAMCNSSTLVIVIASVEPEMGDFIAS